MHVFVLFYITAHPSTIQRRHSDIIRAHPLTGANMSIRMQDVSPEFRVQLKPRISTPKASEAGRDGRQSPGRTQEADPEKVNRARPKTGDAHAQQCPV